MARSHKQPLESLSLRSVPRAIERFERLAIKLTVDRTGENFEIGERLTNHLTFAQVDCRDQSIEVNAGIKKCGEASIFSREEKARMIAGFEKAADQAEGNPNGMRLEAHELLQCGDLLFGPSPHARDLGDALIRFGSLRIELTHALKMSERAIELSAFGVEARQLKSHANALTLLDDRFEEREGAIALRA